MVSPYSRSVFFKCAQLLSSAPTQPRAPHTPIECFEKKMRIIKKKGKDVHVLKDVEKGNARLPFQDKKWRAHVGSSRLKFASVPEPRTDLQIRKVRSLTGR